MQKHVYFSDAFVLPATSQYPKYQKELDESNIPANTPQSITSVGQKKYDVAVFLVLPKT